MAAKTLTEKQRRFVEAYLGQAAGNGTEAARIAGYKGKPDTLCAVGKENLRKPLVMAELQQRLQDDPLVASREERLQFLASVMRNSEEDTRNCLKACELLGKMAGDFVERKIHQFDGIHGSDTADLLKQLPEALAVLEAEDLQ